MATKENLMGLGLPHFLAAAIGNTPIFVTAQGTTIGDAKAVGKDAFDIIANSGTGGVVLKSPASADGYLLGDQVWFTNMNAASVSLFVRNAVCYVNGLSVSGSLGLSVGVGQSCIGRPITASTWTFIGSVLSN